MKIKEGIKDITHNKSRMSIVPSGSDTGINELPVLLKRWITLEEEVATLNAEIRTRKTQGKALKEMILRIMERSQTVAINVNKGTINHRVREQAEPINYNYLMKHCPKFFDGDETKAKALLEFLEKQRSTVVRHDLRLSQPKQDDDKASRRS